MFLQCVLQRITALSVHCEQYNLLQLILGEGVGPSSIIFTLRDTRPAITTTHAGVRERTAVGILGGIL